MPLPEEVYGEAGINNTDVNRVADAFEGVSGESAPRTELRLKDETNRELSRGQLAQALEHAAIAAALDAVNQLCKRVDGS